MFLVRDVSGYEFNYQLSGVLIELTTGWGFAPEIDLPSDCLFTCREARLTTDVYNAVHAYFRAIRKFDNIAIFSFFLAIDKFDNVG